MTTDLWNTREGRLGHYGECLIENWLRKLGFAVFPLTDIDNGSAPSILLDNDVEVITPDFQALKLKHGIHIAVEVKVRTNPTYNRKRKTYQQSLSQRIYKQYQLFEQITGMRVVIIYIQRNPTPHIYMHYAARLEQCIGYGGNHYDKHPDAYWKMVDEQSLYIDLNEFINFPLPTHLKFPPSPQMRSIYMRTQEPLRQHPAYRSSRPFNMFDEMDDDDLRSYFKLV